MNNPERGFSFSNNGPLDMRMNRSEKETAEDIIASMSETELADIFYELGEERKSRKIAEAIVKERKENRVNSTVWLAEVIEKAVGGRRGRIHPATKAFQALRIAVNNELDSLEKGLSAGLNLLVPGGRMAVISFHSLEDRIVKKFFKRHVGRWESLQGGGRNWEGEKPAVSLVNRKVVKPAREETEKNSINVLNPPFASNLRHAREIIMRKKMPSIEPRQS
ncbi:16S rRNA (cytosine(1402)-N(4))-methyltransferase RsmH [Verrucomicrobiota bacterium]